MMSLALHTKELRDLRNGKASLVMAQKLSSVKIFQVTLKNMFSFLIRSAHDILMQFGISKY